MTAPLRIEKHRKPEEIWCVSPDRPVGAECPVGGRTAPGRTRRSADHETLRSAAEESYSEHRGEDLDLTRTNPTTSEGIVFERRLKSGFLRWTTLPPATGYSPDLT